MFKGSPERIKLSQVRWCPVRVGLTGLPLRGLGLAYFMSHVQQSLRRVLDRKALVCSGKLIRVELIV